jgi:hypothetical protein
MGIISKIGKGIKSAFKKIGKGIKRGIKSVGKFMDKIGIVGQIGLAILLPGIGGMLAKGFSTAFSAVTGAMTGYAGIGSSVINAAGGFLNAAGTVVGRMGNAFNSVTGAIKNVVGETLKFGANKLGLGEVASSLGSTFGSQGLTDLGTSISKGSFDNITSAFGEGLTNITDSFSNVFNTESSIAKNLNMEFDPSNVDAAGKPISTASSGVSLEDMSTEIQGIDPSKSLDRMVEGYEAPSLLDNKPIRTVAQEVEASAFASAREQALKTPKAVGDKNFVLETTQEVQKGLAEQLRKKAADVRGGFTAFKEDPLGVTVGYGVDQIKEGVDAGLQQVGMYGITNAAGVDLVPDQIQQNISTYIAPGEAVQVRPAAQITPEYFTANQSIFNQYPWGASSAVIDSNYYQDLNTTMQRMG